MASILKLDPAPTRADREWGASTTPATPCVGQVSLVAKFFDLTFTPILSTRPARLRVGRRPASAACSATSGGRREGAHHGDCGQACRGAPDVEFDQQRPPPGPANAARFSRVGSGRARPGGHDESGLLCCHRAPTVLRSFGPAVLPTLGVTFTSPVVYRSRGTRVGERTFIMVHRGRFVHYDGFRLHFLPYRLARARFFRDTGPTCSSPAARLCRGRTYRGRQAVASSARQGALCNSHSSQSDSGIWGGLPRRAAPLPAPGLRVHGGPLALATSPHDQFDEVPGRRRARASRGCLRVEFGRRCARSQTRPPSTQLESRAHRHRRRDTDRHESARRDSCT